jgi:hypothetical protein
MTLIHSLARSTLMITIEGSNDVREIIDVPPDDVIEARIGAALAEPSVSGVREALSASGTTRATVTRWLPRANGDQDTW